MAKEEISRTTDITVDPVFRTECVGCHKEIVLWYNGGELDMKECCGYSYQLETPQIDFVVYQRSPVAKRAE